MPAFPPHPATGRVHHPRCKVRPCTAPPRAPARENEANNFPDVKEREGRDGGGTPAAGRAGSEDESGDRGGRTGSAPYNNREGNDMPTKAPP
jgi:hypothetical protein